MIGYIARNSFQATSPTMRGRWVREFLPYDIDFLPNVIFRSLLVSEISSVSRNRQSCDADFVQVDSPNGFVRIFIHQENIYATSVVTSAEELGTMSKNNLTGITGDELSYSSSSLEDN